MKHHRSSVITAVLLIGVLTYCSQSFIIGQSKESGLDISPFIIGTPEEVGWNTNELQRLLDSTHIWSDNEEIMGAEVLIIKDNKIILHDAYGWSDKEEGKRLEKNSIFRIKSMTKPFISTSILMLEEQGVIDDIHDPVSKYLPEMNTDNSRQVTIHQLLTHTSGLREIYHPKGIRWDRYKDLQAAVKQIGKDGPAYESGTYRYSDEGAGVAAYLVEKVSGNSLESFLHDKIFEPLDMNSSFFDPKDHPTLKNRMNKSYRYDPGTRKFRKGWSSKNSTSYHMKYLVGAFGILSTTIDYARFTKMVMDAGYTSKKNVLLSRIAAQRATKEHVSNSRGGYSYFFDTNSNKNGSTLHFGHTGVSGTGVFAFPSINTMVFYFTQSMGHANYKKFVKLLRSIKYFRSKIELTEWLRN